MIDTLRHCKWAGATSLMREVFDAHHPILHVQDPLTQRTHHITRRIHLARLLHPPNVNTFARSRMFAYEWHLAFLLTASLWQRCPPIRLPSLPYARARTCASICLYLSVPGTPYAAARPGAAWPDAPAAKMRADALTL